MKRPLDRVMHIAVCVPCGSKRSYLTRPDARSMARRLHNHAGTFRCPHVPDGGLAVYHVGHLPQRVRSGQVTKDRYLNGSGIRVRVEVQGVAVSVTWTDPRDAARAADALLAAAELAAAKGMESLMRRYIGMANDLADAMKRTALPDINPTPAAALARESLLA